MGKINDISKHGKNDEEAKGKVKKLKNALKKHKKEKKKKKKKKKKMKKEIEGAQELSLTKSKMHNSQVPNKTTNNTSEPPSSSNRILGPMTKEEWEKKQSIIQRVYDEETGRQRLIKGDGEVLEEIVSRKHHKEINKQATRGDGMYFQKQLQVNSL